MRDGVSINTEPRPGAVAGMDVALTPACPLASGNDGPEARGSGAPVGSAGSGAKRLEPATGIHAHNRGLSSYCKDAHVRETTTQLSNTMVDIVIVIANIR